VVAELPASVDHLPDKGMCRPVADKFALFILAFFGLLILLLTQSREVIGQIARTTEEWRRMIYSLRIPRAERRSITGLTNSGDADEIRQGRPEEDPEADRQ